MRSLVKFAYLTMKVFLTVIQNGLCGQDEGAEDQENDGKGHENDILEDGMGVGQGEGKQDISD